MRRRDFLTLLGGAACWPTMARAQDAAMPVIGFLSSVSPRASEELVVAFRHGLSAQGYTEGKNLWIYYRWAEGHYDDLDSLAADLVKRKVRVIAATGGLVSAKAAMKATTDIPILFVSGFDPVKLGLVSSLNQPAGNATGVSVYTTELVAKRLELLHELVPKANTIALLVNPGAVITQIETRDMQGAAVQLGIQLIVLNAASESEIEDAFAAAIQQGAGAFLVSADPFFTSRLTQIVSLAAKHALPGAYPWREYAETGGLMSYGPNLTWAYDQIGIYAGRILKGAKPTDLPVQLPTTFDLVVNNKTAKALGIAISPLFMARVNQTVE